MRLTIFSIFILLSIPTSSQNYYLSAALEVMDVFGIDTLFIQPTDAFKKTYESSFYSKTDSLEHLYTCEFRMDGDIMQTRFQTPPKRRIGTSYFKIMEDGSWEDCNRKGKIKSRRPSSYFTTTDTRVNEIDSIVETKEYWIRKNDTLQSGFMNKYVYESQRLIERWSGRCSSADKSCKWSEIKQCHIRKYSYPTVNSTEVRYFKCGIDSLPYMLISFFEITDAKDRIIRIESSRVRFDNNHKSESTMYFLYHQDGFCEKYERYDDGKLVIREITKKL